MDVQGARGSDGLRGSLSVTTLGAPDGVPGEPSAWQDGSDWNDVSDRGIGFPVEREECRVRLACRVAAPRGHLQNYWDCASHLLFARARFNLKRLERREKAEKATEKSFSTQACIYIPRVPILRAGFPRAGVEGGAPPRR